MNETAFEGNPTSAPFLPVRALPMNTNCLLFFYFRSVILFHLQRNIVDQTQKDGLVIELVVRINLLLVQKTLTSQIDLHMNGKYTPNLFPGINQAL